jgi:hypothetical protein
MPVREETTAGSYSWVCPPSVSVIDELLLIGGGANGDAAASGNGGGGGAYIRVTNLSVTPGNTYDFDVGNIGSDTNWNAGQFIAGGASGTTGGSVSGSGSPTNSSAGGDGGFGTTCPGDEERGGGGGSSGTLSGSSPGSAAACDPPANGGGGVAPDSPGGDGGDGGGGNATGYGGGGGGGGGAATGGYAKLTWTQIDNVILPPLEIIPVVVAPTYLYDGNLVLPPLQIIVRNPPTSYIQNIEPQSLQFITPNFGLAQAIWDNAEISIPTYGFGIEVSFDGEISFANGANGDAEISIIAPSISAPTDAYGVHLSQGTVIMHWKHATPDKVAYYELFAAASSAGPFFKYQQGEFLATRGVVNNVPLGISAYFKVRAIGKNGAVSSFINVKQGKIAKPSFAFNVTGIVGSTIPKDAIFTSIDTHTGLLIAIKADFPITIS